MPEEAASHYAADIINLELSNEELSILIRLQVLALDYVKRRQNAAKPILSPLFRRAEERLENLGYRLKHLADQGGNGTFIEGDAIVFLAHLGNPIAVGPQAARDYDFMRAESTTNLILNMKEALDKIHEGYRHPWILNTPPGITVGPTPPSA